MRDRERHIQQVNDKCVAAAALGAFTLRGINVDDLGYLLEQHGESVGLLVADEPDFAGLLTMAPALVADIVAVAADEPHAADVVRRMPAPLQITLLVEVFKLTFTGVEMGNVLRLFVEAITRQPKNPQESPVI